jgi:hypothetical protein
MYAFIFYSLIVTSGSQEWVIDYDLLESDCQLAVVHFEQVENLFVDGVTFDCYTQP